MDYNTSNTGGQIFAANNEAFISFYTFNYYDSLGNKTQPTQYNIGLKGQLKIDLRNSTKVCYNFEKRYNNLADRRMLKLVSLQPSDENGKSKLVFYNVDRLIGSQKIEFQLNTQFQGLFMSRQSNGDYKLWLVSKNKFQTMVVPQLKNHFSIKKNHTQSSG